MKTRNSLVSNSSSSSFMIYKKNLCACQIDKIKNHIEEGKKLGMNSTEHDAWSVRDHGEAIEVYTNMDNFDMVKFLGLIDVDTEKIDWRDY